MTRRVVYGIGIWIALAATAMTIASIISPRWLSYSPDGTTTQLSYGLHRRCSRPRGGACTPFPKPEDCQSTSSSRTFCSMWRTVGFLMSFAVVVELATLVSYIVVLAGGKQRRDGGWRVVGALLFVGAAAQCAAMAIVAFLFDEEDRFFEGWQLDVSWILCTVSWATSLLAGVGLVAAAILMPEEGDYELIPN